MSNKVRQGTHFVLSEEPAYGLSEVELQAPGSTGWHRYQIITVVRGDELADFKKDLGPRGLYPHAQPFVLVAGIKDSVTGKIECLYTVQELVEAAEQKRATPCNVNNLERTFHTKKDMEEGYHDYIDHLTKFWRKGDYTQYGYGN